MAEIIRMPRLSDTMEEGNIVGWLVNVGDTVGVGDILAEVETDKATMELESFQEGTLLYIGIKEGPVPVDGILAVIGEKGEDFQKLLDEANATAPAEESPAKVEVQDKAESAAAPMSSHSAPATSASKDSRIKASPLAKSMAAESNIQLAKISGSGEGGRIIKRDIEEAIKSGGANSNQARIAYIAPKSDFEYGSKPVSQMRKTIAKRLSESKFTAPHFYLTVEINMDKAVQARKEMNAEEGVKISFNDLVIKASAVALQKHPVINASWGGDSITYHQDINIGVAVAIDEGLVVPVLTNANLKPLSLINSQVKALAGKARDRKLSLAEMQGNTFTISNLGMFGIEEFTAIINAPDACILAVGSIIKKPSVVNDQIQVASMMKVTLSCDHRIVDGVSGAKFLQTFKGFLENPVRLLV